MPRGRKPSSLKLELLLYALKIAEDWLWVRELARRTGLPRSTVSFYLSKYLSDKVEIQQAGSLKRVRLKQKHRVPEYVS